MVKTGRMQSRISLFAIFNTLLMLLLAFVMLYPFVYMLAVSLSSDVYVMKGEVTLWPKGWNLRMYELVLGDPNIWTSYRNTIIYTVLGTAIAMLVTSMGAYALSRKDMTFHRGFTLMIVFTMFFGGGMIPTFLVVRSLGLVDTIWGMVLPGAVSTWNLILMRTFFSGIPKELEESGRIDGLNDIGIFFSDHRTVVQTCVCNDFTFLRGGNLEQFFVSAFILEKPGTVPAAGASAQSRSCRERQLRTGHANRRG